MQHLPVAIILSGLDPTGGAGILADIRAMTAAGVRIAPLITANTLQGKDIDATYIATNAGLVSRQLDLIYKLYSPKALKIGMLGSAEIATVIKDFLTETSLPTVLDPVMTASSGGLLGDSVIKSAINDIARYITLLTPNLDELFWLTDDQTDSSDDIEQCIKILYQTGFQNVLVKGGHSSGHPRDFLFCDGLLKRTFTGKRYATVIRGTGCHLAAYAAGMLARNRTVETAAEKSYYYVQHMLLNYTLAGNGIIPADCP